MPKNSKKTASHNQYGDLCEGFHFRYYTPDKLGRRREKKEPDSHFIAAENRFLDIVVSVLLNRQDLLEDIMCMTNGLEVKLYKGTGFRDFKNDVYFFGRVTHEGDQMFMELATAEVLKGAQKGHEVLNVVVHELVHVLDFLDGQDGLMPGWSRTQAKAYREARDAECLKIKAGKSPIDSYALSSRTDFLAVLAETYFIRPKALKRSSPELFEIMKSFFKVRPEEVGILWEPEEESKPHRTPIKKPRKRAATPKDKKPPVRRKKNKTAGRKHP